MGKAGADAEDDEHDAEAAIQTEDWGQRPQVDAGGRAIMPGRVDEVEDAKDDGKIARLVEPAPAKGAFSITDRQIPRIVRVSRGSMTPSS